jgi:hypothetical protein
MIRSGCRCSFTALFRFFFAACTLLSAGLPVFAENTQHSYLKLPLSFEPNVGQADNRFQFVSRGGGYSLFVNPAEATLKLRGGKADADAQLQMTLLGADKAAEGRGSDLLTGKSNYLLGSDPAQWRTNIPNFGQVEYRSIYPGIDLIYYGNQRRLEYDFVVAPGGDPKAIRLDFTGARNLKVDDEGNLIVDMAGGTVNLEKPEVYQNVNGVRNGVRGKYLIAGKHEVRFDIGAYDRSKELVIDPVLTFSTYLGGFAGDDLGYGVGADASGNGYVVGIASSMDFPTRNPIQGSPAGGSDTFITKFSPTGGLVYSTYLGGAGMDQANSVVADASGNAYVTGFTSSTNFPTVTPLQAANAGGDSDVFVTKLNAAGTAILYSTYLGGTRADRGHGIAIDSLGSAHVTGFTDSADFRLANAFQGISGGFSDTFVSKLSASGTSLVYSTYLGGSNADQGNGIAVDTVGNAYVAGTTSSFDFPVQFPIFGPAGSSDAFITKFNAAGTALLYSTYLGGSFFDQGNGVAVDAGFNAYVVGRANSPDFPTMNAVQAVHAGSADAFVTKVNATGTGLMYSTYVGGSGFDQGLGISLDGTGSAYITGSTGSANFPTLNAFQPTPKTLGEAFITALSNTGSSYVYSTFLGGDGGDIGTSIAVYTPPPPNPPQAFVTGYTDSFNFPTVAAFQPTKGPGFKAFATNIPTPSPAPAVATLTFNPNPVNGGSTSTGTVTLVTPAPSGGTTITLYSYDTSIASVPASFVIPAGSLSGTFTATTSPVTTAQSVTIRASSGTSADEEVLQVTPVPPQIVEVQFNPPTVTGGQTSIGAVILSSGAPAGTVINLSSNSVYVNVPPSVVVTTEGANVINFTATTLPPPSVVNATVTATLGSSSRGGMLTVLPLVGSITGLSFSPNPVQGGQSSTGSVSISQPAPTGGAVVTLVSSNPAIVMVPSSVTVPAGSTTANFTATTTAPQTTTPVPVTATLNGTVTTTLTVLPPKVSSLSFSPASVPGGTSSTGTVTLDNPAPAGGAVVALSSNSPYVIVPASVLVPATATSATFTATTTNPPTMVTATVTATYNGTAQGTLTVKPVTPPLPFLPFSMLQIDANIHSDSFLVKGTFKLGPGNNGINPVNEIVALKVGPFATAIPAGSFKAVGNSHYKFNGTVNGVSFNFDIKAGKNGVWDLHVNAHDANMTGTTNPVTVVLIVGNDGGIWTGTAKIHKTSGGDEDDDEDDD